MSVSYSDSKITFWGVLLVKIYLNEKEYIDSTVSCGDLSGEVLVDLLLSQVGFKCVRFKPTRVCL